ncbi:Hypothetical predicted protein, partial [Olea europaea subsp. europaea]
QSLNNAKPIATMHGAPSSPCTTELRARRSATTSNNEPIANSSNEEPIATGVVRELGNFRARSI